MIGKEATGDSVLLFQASVSAAMRELGPGRFQSISLDRQTQIAINRRGEPDVTVCVAAALGFIF